MKLRVVGTSPKRPRRTLSGCKLQGKISGHAELHRRLCVLDERGDCRTVQLCRISRRLDHDIDVEEWQQRLCDLHSPTTTGQVIVEIDDGPAAVGRNELALTIGELTASHRDRETTVALDHRNRV